MWEALTAVVLAMAGGFWYLAWILGRLDGAVDDIKNNHLQHIYAALESIQNILMKRD
jgi:hypothetical protein